MNQRTAIERQQRSTDGSGGRAVYRRRLSPAAALLVGSLFVLSGCGAVFPEVSTPVRDVPANETVKPLPPEDVYFIAFVRAKIPKRTRDGRSWQEVGGDAPDPFAKFIVGDQEIIVTPVQSNTLEPTWPGQVRANYRVPGNRSIRVELWDSNPVNDHPICNKGISNLEDEAGYGEVRLDCDSGARVFLTVEPARAKLGLGLYYELQTQGARVTRVISESPAARAGIEPEMDIVAIQGRPTAGLDDVEIRSLVNANARTGLKLRLKNQANQFIEVDIKEGAMYPLVNEGIPVD